MLKICNLMIMSALLIAIALTSGCYTVVGYRAAMEENIIEEEAVEGQVYEDYEYYYDRPYSYYRDYYDPYYGLRYPYSYYYYRDYPYRRYDPYYYWDYDGPYVPEKTKRRGAVELRRAPKPERQDGSKLEEKDEESKRSRMEIQSGRRAEDRIRRSVKREHRDSTSGSKKRSVERKAEDEEE